MKPPHSLVLCVCMYVCVGADHVSLPWPLVPCEEGVCRGGGGVSLWTSSFFTAWLSLQMLCEKSIPAGWDWDCDKGTDWVSGCSAGHGEGAQSET